MGEQWKTWIRISWFLGRDLKQDLQNTKQEYQSLYCEVHLESFKRVCFAWGLANVAAPERNVHIWRDGCSLSFWKAPRNSTFLSFVNLQDNMKSIHKNWKSVKLENKNTLFSRFGGKCMYRIHIHFLMTQNDAGIGNNIRKKNTCYVCLQTSRKKTHYAHGNTESDGKFRTRKEELYGVEWIEEKYGTSRIPDLQRVNTAFSIWRSASDGNGFEMNTNTAAFWSEKYLGCLSVQSVLSNQRYMVCIQIFDWNLIQSVDL